MLSGKCAGAAIAGRPRPGPAGTRARWAGPAGRAAGRGMSTSRPGRDGGGHRAGSAPSTGWAAITSSGTGRHSWPRSAAARSGRTRTGPGKPMASRRRRRGRASAGCCPPERRRARGCHPRRRLPSRARARPGPRGDRAPRDLGQPGRLRRRRRRSQAAARRGRVCGSEWRPAERLIGAGVSPRRGPPWPRAPGQLVRAPWLRGQLAVDVLEQQDDPAVRVDGAEQPRGWRAPRQRCRDPRLGPVDAWASPD